MRRYTFSKIIVAVATVFAFTACSDEFVVQGDGVGGVDDYWSQYDFVISDGADTRVTYDNVNHATFDAGDEVGVYVVDEQGNLVQGQPANVRYTVRDVTNLNTGEQRQVLLPTNPDVAVTKNDAYRYVLYYPYNLNMALYRLKNYTHTVAYGQNSAEAFEASDLLWCYYAPPSGTTVYTVAFDHAMAQIIVEADESATGVELLNMPLAANNINLVQPMTDVFGYNVDVPSYPATPENTPIEMYKFGYASSGNKIFRACVPAHTFDKDGIGIPAVRITNGNETKVYKISTKEGGFTFRPGYNYTLTLTKGETTSGLEIGEDDSWVLDVLDPETGEPVGLLCREYLRYQPGGAHYPHTGNVIPGEDNSKYVNSQAWVFYNLRADGTPELSHGTVLRFTYDVQINYNAGTSEFGDAQAYLPAPHENTDVQGIFLPRHGYYWTTMSHGDYLLDGKYGTELNVADATDARLKEQNYHMHGGEVHWGYADGHSLITRYDLPEKDQYSTYETLEGVAIGDGSGYITNKQAYYYGHIAIREDGSVGVSYMPISADNKYMDVEGCKVGVLQQHYLVDRRVNSEGEVEENRYPLVKIGHNQFWMSKSLRTATLTDGTPLMCCNKVTGDGSKPATTADGLDWNNEFGPSYMYPFSQNVNYSGIVYDPVNDPDEMRPTPIEHNGTYSPAPCYNSTAVNDSRFVPKSGDSRLYYLMPTGAQFEDMSKYFGMHFAAKIATDQIAKRVNDVFVSESGENVDYYAVKYGKTYQFSGTTSSGTTSNYYAANVSGLNLRAVGSFYSHSSAGTTFNAMTGNAVIMLKNANADQDGMDYMDIPVYSPFENADFSNCLKTNQNGTDISNHPSHFFAQVRLVMKFRDQLDNGGAASYSAVRSATRGGGGKAKSRNVWVQLVP